MVGVLVRFGLKVWPAVRSLLVLLGVLDAGATVLGGDDDNGGGMEATRARVALAGVLGILALLVLVIIVLGLTGRLHLGKRGRS